MKWQLVPGKKQLQELQELLAEVISYRSNKIQQTWVPTFQPTLYRGSKAKADKLQDTFQIRLSFLP